MHLKKRALTTIIGSNKAYAYLGIIVKKMSEKYHLLMPEKRVPCFAESFKMSYFQLVRM